MYHDSNVFWHVCNDSNDWKSSCITIIMCCDMCAMILKIVNQNITILMCCDMCAMIIMIGTQYVSQF
jgi:maltodextrin utilization protein YvdJ